MKHRIPAFPLALALALSLPTLTLTAQEGGEPEKDRPVLSEDVLGGQDRLSKELERLFHEVEQKLIDIDVRLADAGAGETSLAELEDAGIEKLLRDSQAKSQQVLSGIDEILKLAEEMGQQQSQPSGGGGQGESKGDSPLEQSRDNGPQQRENTPDAPKENEGEQEGQPQDGEQPGQKPEGEQPKDGEDPDSPGKADQRGENQKGDPDHPEGGAAVPRNDDANRWGELPQRLQETFRNQGREDLPLQYRDWIDSYYRRLNRTR